MKKYENMDNFREREHIIEVTLQSGEYKGTVKEKISGNCFGLSILNCFDPENIEVDDEFYENDCDLRIIEDDDGEYWYTCKLTNEQGEDCYMEDDARGLENLIVKLEIVNCTIKAEINEMFD